METAFLEACASRRGIARWFALVLAVVDVARARWMLRSFSPIGLLSLLIKLIVQPVTDHGRSSASATEGFKFAASVASFGMLLRDSPHKPSLELAGATKLLLEKQN